MNRIFFGNGINGCTQLDHVKRKLCPNNQDDQFCSKVQLNNLKKLKCYVIDFYRCKSQWLKLYGYQNCKKEVSFPENCYLFISVYLFSFVMQARFWVTVYTLFGFFQSSKFLSNHLSIEHYRNFMKKIFFCEFISAYKNCLFSLHTTA